MSLGARAPERVVIPLADGTMSALAWGPRERAPDLVFLHANGFHARVYQGLLGPLSAERRVIALDLRGHGRTTLPADPARLSSWTTYRDDVLAALDHIAPQPVALAGHSLGATVAVLAASKLGERCAGLVLLEVVAMPPPLLLASRWSALRRAWTSRMAVFRAARRRRERFSDRAAVLAAYRGRGAFRHWPDATLADYVADGVRERADGEVELACAPAWEAASFAAQDYDLYGAAARVRARAHALLAGRGSTCPPPAAGLLRLLMKRLQVERLPAAPHLFPMTTPAPAQAALAKLLRV